MTLRRRLWVLLLSAAMLLTLFPAAAFADDPVNDAAKVPEPKWVVYEGPTLQGVLGTDTLLNLETPDLSSFIVTYTDGSERTFTYRKKDYKDESIEDEEYQDYTVGAFIPEDDPAQDPLNAEVCLFAEVKQSSEEMYSFKKEWNDNVELEVLVQYAIPGEDGSEEVAIKALPAYVDVLCAADAYPKKVEFVPADGFTVECTAGFNYLTEDAFYGEGNKFVVSYNGWRAGDPDLGIAEGFEDYTTTYVYAKGTDPDGEEVEGFFAGEGNVNNKQFILDDGAFFEIEFDETQDVEFTYTEYVPEYDEDVAVDFTVPVKATKYTASANNPIYKFTGSVIQPKFKVYDDAGDLIPAEAYDVEHENASKMGWYEAKITFNDQFADKDKYTDFITTSYGIGPQAPTIYKPAAGKGKLTVKWKKPTSAQLKNFDGYYIELSTDKYFYGNYKRVWVSKTTVKKGKKVVKSLKKGRKYYVRLYAYKKITQDGETFKMESNYSKVKIIKTKK